MSIELLIFFVNRNIFLIESSFHMSSVLIYIIYLVIFYNLIINKILSLTYIISDFIQEGMYILYNQCFYT